MKKVRFQLFSFANNKHFITFSLKKVFILVFTERELTPCSPNQTDSETLSFFEGLSDKCDDIRKQHPYSELIMVGDFNAHHKEWLNHRDTNIAGRNAEWLAIPATEQSCTREI